jgi:anti-anti-sigma regulatory factor
MPGTTARPRRGRAAASGHLATIRVSESAWIIRPTGSLARGVVGSLRDAFLELVDAGAEDVVLDLSGVDAITPVGAETIAAMADHMHGRNATLWLAARRPEGDGHTLRAIDEAGGRGLRGVSAVLDAALPGTRPGTE